MVEGVDDEGEGEGDDRELEANRKERARPEKASVRGTDGLTIEIPTMLRHTVPDRNDRAANRGQQSAGGMAASSHDWVVVIGELRESYRSRGNRPSKPSSKERIASSSSSRATTMDIQSVMLRALSAWRRSSAHAVST